MSLLLLLLTVVMMINIGVVNSQSQHQIITYDVSASNSAAAGGGFQVGYNDDNEHPCACTYDGLDSGETGTQILNGVEQYQNTTNKFFSFESSNSYFFSTKSASTLICDQECKCEYANVDESLPNPFVPNGTLCTVISTSDGNIPLSPFDGMYDILYDVTGFEEVSYVCPIILRSSDDDNQVAIERGLDGGFLNQETFTPTENMNGGKPSMGIKYSNPKYDESAIIYIKTDDTCTCIGSNSCGIIETNSPTSSPSEFPTTTTTTTITSNSCFENVRTPGCSNQLCQRTVCMEDDFCCERQWDSNCVAKAMENLNVCNTGFPPQENNCFEVDPFERSGCDNSEFGIESTNSSTCFNIVCENREECCDGPYDQDCVNTALDNCPLPEPRNNCFEVGDDEVPGCSDTACAERVCLGEPNCCTRAPWNEEICINEARNHPDVCKPPNSTNHCDTESLYGGCEDKRCEEIVCGAEPHCCNSEEETGQWNDYCVLIGDCCCNSEEETGQWNDYLCNLTGDICQPRNETNSPTSSPVLPRPEGGVIETNSPTSSPSEFPTTTTTTTITSNAADDGRKGMSMVVFTIWMIILVLHYVLGDHSF